MLSTVLKPLIDYEDLSREAIIYQILNQMEKVYYDAGCGKFESNLCVKDEYVRGKIRALGYDVDCSDNKIKFKSSKHSTGWTPEIYSKDRLRCEVESIVLEEESLYKVVFSEDVCNYIDSRKDSAYIRELCTKVLHTARVMNIIAQTHIIEEAMKPADEDAIEISDAIKRYNKSGCLEYTFYIRESWDGQSKYREAFNLMTKFGYLNFCLIRYREYFKGIDIKIVDKDKLLFDWSSCLSFEKNKEICQPGGSEFREAKKHFENECAQETTRQ